MLVARYTLRAHRAAWLLGAGEDADDVVQEAFVKAFRNLPKFRAGQPFAPWLPAGASLPSAPRPTASVSSASVPAAPALAAAPKPSGTTAPAWLIATIASAAAIVIAVTALWLRRRPRPAAGRQ